MDTTTAAPTWTSEPVRIAAPQNFQEAVEAYLDFIADNWAGWRSEGMPTRDEFRANLSTSKGARFIKVIRTAENGQRSVHSFIERDNGNVWKAAGWKAPALNFTRGNIFKPAEFKGRITWTGAEGRA